LIRFTLILSDSSEAAPSSLVGQSV